MISAVIIEGVTFPVAYNGYTYSRNKIWSKNTGRNDKCCNYRGSDIPSSLQRLHVQ
nr:MAG TPA: hypothetical protein [Bacteriophage sp.]